MKIHESTHRTDEAHEYKSIGFLTLSKVALPKNTRQILQLVLCESLEVIY